MLTCDQDYISRFRNQPMTFQQRLIYALQALGVGLYEGVIGQPPHTHTDLTATIAGTGVVYDSAISVGDGHIGLWGLWDCPGWPASRS